ncbi:hypothetical protein ARMGADRAFT_609530 [Armillaria gallica]|uniref:Uncharacterized protein n=1 Tax=Armillaria gallica TaxID=47427 RepID=A0A2H3D5U5_ARMGA|nr:hypothetical protein ARMGADRAFT_609530 [Armillaria gallica]
MVDGSARMALVWKMFWKMDVRPLGLCSVRDRRATQMDACWTEKCSGCERLVYDRLGNTVKPRGVEGTSDVFHDCRVYLLTHLVPTSMKDAVQ